MEDLERFTRRSRLEGVSCGQKSYKSEQIEQINVDEKRFGEFGKIWRISRRSRLKESDMPLGLVRLLVGEHCARRDEGV